MRRLALVLLAVALLAGCGGDDSSDSPPEGSFDADRAFADLEAQAEIGPRPSGSPGAREARELIEDGLAAAGVEEVRVERPYANIAGVLPGSEPGTVVVGAHYDTKGGIPGFEGANDGASGVAVLLELARSLPRPLPGPSVELVFFDAEEARAERAFVDDGARGSRQYVAEAAAGSGGGPRLNEIRAMVLFDLVADCDLRIPREEYSDEALYERFAESSREADGDSAPFTGEAAGVLDDHIPFRDAGIPAVDLIDFTYGPGGSPGAYWHTPEDTVDRVCPESLDAVGEAAVRAIPSVR